MSNQGSSASGVRSRTRNRNWIWVFAALGVLGALAILINLIWVKADWSFKPAAELTTEQLNNARALWKANRPANYDLKIVRAAMYSASDGSSGTTVDRIDLQVRGGKIVSFLLNGREPEPLLDRDNKRNVDEERRQRESYDIDGLFDAMEEFMQIDKREANRSFLRASFDKHDGHVTLFTRQVSGKRGVPQIQVELKRVD